jgi:CheY-like chemotaxis protein
MLDDQLQKLQEHLNGRLGPRTFSLALTEEACEFLIGQSENSQDGSGDIKRYFYRHIVQPLATLVAQERVHPGSTLMILADESGKNLRLEPRSAEAPLFGSDSFAAPSVLLVDDNQDLLHLLSSVMSDNKWETLPATTGAKALELAQERAPDIAVIDSMLPDLDGVKLSEELHQRFPALQIILMSGPDCASFDESGGKPSSIHVIQKPFLIDDVVALVRERIAAEGTRITRSEASHYFG